MVSFEQHLRPENGPLAGLRIGVDSRGIWHMDEGRGPAIDWLGWGVALYAMVLVGIGFAAGAIWMALGRRQEESHG